MWRIIVAPKAQRQLSKIKKLHKKAIAEAISDLANYPYNGKKLERDLAGKFSYRVGIYRIIYVIRELDSIVYVISAGHRSTIYQ